MSTPFKMKGLSGFGSPIENNITNVNPKKTNIAYNKIKQFANKLIKPGAIDNSTLPLGPDKPNTFKSEIKRAWKNVKNPTPRGFTTPTVESNLARAGNWVGKNVKVAGNLLGGVGIALTLKDMYQSGQKYSGGRVGYEPNPNAKKGGPKHGDSGSGAQFIPTKRKSNDYTKTTYNFPKWGNNKKK